MSIKIKVFGYRGLFNATDRLEQAFLDLGCESSDEPEMIYHANGLFQDAEEFISKLNYKPFTIYNLLDVDIHKPIEFYEKAINDLNKCNIAATISDYSRNQIKNILGINRDIEILRFPIQPIKGYDIPFKNRYLKYLFVGRLHGKRFNLIKEYFDKYNINYDDLCIVGPERPPFGIYYGMIPPSHLEYLYNKVRFVLCPSKQEGLGMCAIEGTICSIPIVCNDLTTLEELNLQPFAAEPTAEGIHNKILEIESNLDYYLSIARDLGTKFREEFDVNNIAKKILDLYKENR